MWNSYKSQSKQETSEQYPQLRGGSESDLHTWWYNPQEGAEYEAIKHALSEEMRAFLGRLFGAAAAGKPLPTSSKPYQEGLTVNALSQYMSFASNAKLGHKTVVERWLDAITVNESNPSRQSSKNQPSPQISCNTLPCQAISALRTWSYSLQLLRTVP